MAIHKRCHKCQEWKYNCRCGSSSSPGDYYTPKMMEVSEMEIDQYLHQIETLKHQLVNVNIIVWALLKSNGGEIVVNMRNIVTAPRNPKIAWTDIDGNTKRKYLCV